MTGAPMTPTQVRAFYEGGGDLRRARGYHAKGTAERALRPAHGAPRDATDRSVLGISDTADATALRKWRRKGAPDWVPGSRSSMGDDTAAVLSRVGIHPRNWKKVRIDPVSGTRMFTMTITPRRGYSRTVLLQDQDMVSEVTRLINHTSRASMAGSAAERRRLEREWKTRGGRVPSMKVDVAGTDEAWKRRKR